MACVVSRAESSVDLGRNRAAYVRRDVSNERTVVRRTTVLSPPMRKQIDLIRCVFIPCLTKLGGPLIRSARSVCRVSENMYGLLLFSPFPSEKETFRLAVYRGPQCMWSQGKDLFQFAEGNHRLC